MRRLSPLDAAFLYLERRHAPLHVGALSLFTPPRGAGADFGAQLDERLRQSSRAASPFNRRLDSHFGVHAWVDDEHFDLAHHFVHLSLPKPGRIRELLAMVSRVHSAHLDRAYPLWRTYLIEGLEDGRIATYSKIHHSVVDGVAGIRLMLKSMAPSAADSLEMPPPWELKPSRARTDTPVHTVAGFRAIAGLARQGLKSVPAVYGQIQQTIRDFRAHHPDLVTSFQAPRCIFNQHITGSRRFAAQSYATARFRAVATRLGGTLNDVVLAICGAALRRYLSDQNALPDKPLIAAVPVSIRRDEGSSEGNEVAAALVNLATHTADPLKRFAIVKGSMDYNKQHFRQMTPAQLLAYTAATLSPGLLTYLPGITRNHVVANVVISHVPGPREEMHWQGCRLDGIYPASLLLDGFALNITLVSRFDKIDFGLLACRRTVPQMQRLLEYFEQGLADLKQASR